MKKIALISLAALSFFAGAAQAAVQTIKAEVNGMVCAFCAQGIEKKMRSLSETGDVYVNLKKKIVAVEIKEGKTLLHDTVKNIVKEAGYEVAKIETVNVTAKQVKASLGKE